MAISWTKKQRERAKANGKCLIALAVDGRTATPPFGMMEMTAPVSREFADKVWALIDEYAAIPKEQ